MKAGFVQFEPRFGAPEYNRHAAFSLMEKSTSRLLVLPELFTTGYLFVSKKEVEEMAEEIPRGITTRRLMEFARDKNCYVVGGLAERAGDKYFNSSVIVGPGGYIATYRKAHLFNEEKLFFSPGDLPFEVYDIGEARVGMLICFDWFFPESARALALMGADIVAHCANLVLPHCPAAMITRCIENRVFAITADRV